MDTLLDHALRYAARGWPVFPCHPETKRPLVAGEVKGEGGVKLATTDAGQVRAWWVVQYPRAMIGLATGQRAGVFVVDVDAGHDKKTGEVFDAVDLVAALERELGERLPQTCQATTPRGGYHLYFALPAGELPGNRAGIVDRVDVRGEGGYVILPPSARADGVPYAWEHAPDDVAPAEPPAELVDCILRRGRWSGTRGATESDPGGKISTAEVGLAERDEAVRKYALAALDAEAEIVACSGRGTRNNALNTAALKLGELVAAGAIAEAIVRATLEDAAGRCGLIQEDGIRSVRATLESGLGAGLRNPRDLSEIRAAAAERAERARRYGPQRRASGRLQPAGPHDRSDGARQRPPDSRSEGAPAPSSAPAAPQPPQQNISAQTLASGGNGGHPPPPIPDEAFAECAELDQSDTDNGKRLRRYFGRELLIREETEVPAGTWAHWTGNHWDLNGGAAGARILAQQLGDLILIEADFMSASPRELKAIEAGAAAKQKLKDLEAIPEDEWGDEQRRAAEEYADALRVAKLAREALNKRKTARRKFAVSSKNKARIEAMLDCAAPHLRLPPEAFNPDPLKVATRTHTLTFVQRADPECPDPDATRMKWVVEAEPTHRREDLITALVPIAYDPEVACPKWCANLQRFQPREDKRRTVQAYSGLGLLNKAIQRVMFHHGSGANFKSTFLETLTRVLGPSLAVGMPTEAIIGTNVGGGGQATPEIARLYGKRFLRVHELPQGTPVKADLIKKLTGGEQLPARSLFKGFFEFTPTCKTHMSGNDLPTFDGSDGGMRRRLILVEWTETIPEAEQRDIEEVIADLLEEASGILNWLIEGALDYLNNGLVIADEIRIGTQAHIDELDPVGQFARACVEPVPGESVQARNMYLAYCAWSITNAKKPMSEARFGRIMPKKFPRDDSGRRHLYVDVRLHDVPELPSQSPPPAQSPDDFRF